MVISVRFFQRNDTAAAWASANPILGAGEIGLESDTGKFKIGNGTTAWNSLAYWSGSPAKYIIGFSFTAGVLANNQLLGLHEFAVAVTIPANFGAYSIYTSQAGGTANAAGSTVMTVAKALAASPNTFSTIGTITIALGTVTPTFATTGGVAQSFAQGDMIRVTGPATADATFANFYCTIVAHE
jgi:hypothetical protein